VKGPRAFEVVEDPGSTKFSERTQTSNQRPAITTRHPPKYSKLAHARVYSQHAVDILVKTKRRDFLRPEALSSYQHPTVIRAKPYVRIHVEQLWG
jgi:hypothetical protein